MKLTRTRLCGVLAAAGILAGGGALAAQAADATPAPGSSTPAAAAPQPPRSQTVLIDCAGGANVVPDRIILSCGDANDRLSSLQWKSWGHRNAITAFATGFEFRNDCKPNCAEGHFHRYGVLVVLWHPHRESGHWVFTRATIVYRGKRPPVYNSAGTPTHPVTATLPLPTH